MDVSFDVPAEAYDRFMGRFSRPLAEQFLHVLRPEGGLRALDVGCGTGALTERLVEHLGPGAVSAVDPSPTFVEAARSRCPQAAVMRGAAEQLPFEGDAFDLAAAQLVVHFMADPVAGLREMARVTRPGGTVGASVWDHAGHRGPLSPMWRVAERLDEGGPGEGALPGAREGHLAELFTAAGLHLSSQSVLRVSATFPTFDDWWVPFTFGVGPAGVYVTALDAVDRQRLREACAEALGEPPITINASAWCVTATVSMTEVARGMSST